jgi:hypothetical protein
MKSTAIIHLRTEGGYKTVVGVHASQECMKEETEEYYEILQEQIQQQNKNRLFVHCRRYECQIR